MKNKKTLFKHSNNVTDIAMTTPVLNKLTITTRLRNTTLHSTSTSFELDTWKPEDETSPIYWMIANTVIGEVLVASTMKGVCFLGFTNGEHTFAFADLQRRFPRNTLLEKSNERLDAAVEHLNNPELNLPVPLHLKGTDFQLNTWKNMMRIPFGGLSTYGKLGNSLQHA